MTQAQKKMVMNVNSILVAEMEVPPLYPHREINRVRERERERERERVRQRQIYLVGELLDE